jgi:type I restriction enzyme R subunit
MESFKDASSHLKLLIVTDMLLTGFDAPVEQVMFLDKPLRGAKLLQAIMRTNRPYPERGKDRGVIIDYWGVFDRLQAAFAEFSPEDIEMLVAGMPKQDDYERMMWLLARFMNDKEAAELFEERFKAVQSAYETLAPDPSLVPHRRPCPRSGSPDQIEPALTVIPEASVRELDDLVEAAQSGA